MKYNSMSNNYIIISFLLSCFVTISSAQNVIKRDRIQSEIKTEHLTFENIPIDGEISVFWKIFEEHGYTVKCKKGNDFDKYTDATIAGIQNWIISACADGIDEDYVYGVKMTHDFTRGSTLLDCYERMKTYIETKYPITNTVFYIGDNSLNDKDTEVHYMIAGKGKIIISYTSTNKGLNVDITFLDKENETTKKILPIRNYYELNPNSEIYEKCSIETSNNDIKFYVKNKNNIYRFLSRGEDRSLINELIQGNYDNKMKLLLINNYILAGIERCKSNDAIPIIEKQFLGICNNYLKIAKEQNRQDNTTPTNIKDAILEEIRKMIFSPNERKTLDKVIPPEVTRKMIGGAINFMGSSSQGYYTDYEKYINPYAHD